MKEIPLSQTIKKKYYVENQVVMVDDEDYEWLNKFHWHIRKTKNIAYAMSAATTEYPHKKTMHRMIMGITDSKVYVDHKDGNGLNNQRSNLRIATFQQNSVNRRKLKPLSSKYLGVYWCNTKNRWKSYLQNNRKRIYVGTFKNEDDAAMAYNAKSIEINGEFASLNVI